MPIIFRNLPIGESEKIEEALDRILSCQFSNLPEEFFISEMFWWFPHYSTRSYVSCLKDGNVTQSTLDICREHLHGICASESFGDNSWLQFCRALIELYRHRSELDRQAHENFVSQLYVDYLFQDKLLRRAQAYNECVNNVFARISPCIEQLKNECHKRNVRVVKTIRLGLNIINRVRKRQRADDFKIIHLFRDPRAMIHSRRVWLKDLATELKVTCARL